MATLLSIPIFKNGLPAPMSESDSRQTEGRTDGPREEIPYSLLPLSQKPFFAMVLSLIYIRIRL